jgi:hypothetical protein
MKNELGADEDVCFRFSEDFEKSIRPLYPAKNAIWWNNILSVVPHFLLLGQLKTGFTRCG